MTESEPAGEAVSEPRIQRVPGTSRRVRYSADSIEAVAQNVSLNTQPPEPSADSTNQAWHDPDDNNDDRLRRDKPPHWS
ncbi:hypothetical protein [Homoserinimonas sp. OAct 916]|uniref:hypothetical protein n=1 Tax=Homoserinimonas sp. OAct 916 TaxID=2211450 RepID=UPI0013002598|nr:hypothetical protein [Homoserinimonas sp. OAct 916]